MADSPGAGRLPLSALLSRALVAFTIEFDNEAERQIPHRTTSHGGTPGGVWLVSMAMWLNCMRYVGEDPITVGEVRRLARTGTNLDGMRRWGYVTLGPDQGGGRTRRRDDALLMRATRKGLGASAVWRPLTGVIEDRWRERYGAAAIGRLTETLRTVASQLGDELPDCLPILGYGLFSVVEKPGKDGRGAGRSQPAGGSRPGEPLPLPWLLARVLLGLAVEFEQESAISLAIAANALRLINDSGTRIKDLPVLSGVSAEGLAMATGYLERHGFAVVGTGPDGGRLKVVRPTPEGSKAAQASDSILAAIEDRWQARFGAAPISALRQVLEPLAGDPGADDRPEAAPLFAAIEPYPDGWRASVRRPVTLPHYPMVLHRGGYPDGS
jgi:DNA-binding MarR family transcriptional regulator